MRAQAFVLVGVGAAVGALVAMLAPRCLPTTGAVAPRDTDVATPAPTPAAAPAPRSSFEPAADGSFTEEQLAAFGKIYDVVLERRKSSEQAKHLRTQVERAGIALSVELEGTILRLQKEFQERRQELFRSARGTMMTEADGAAMRTKTDELRARFEADLRASVPEADADKIVAAMKSGFPGFFPRSASASR